MENKQRETKILNNIHNKKDMEAKNIFKLNKLEEITKDENLNNIINDKTYLTALNINENIDKFTYQSKEYYIYTPKSLRQSSKYISWRCNIYKKYEKIHKGKG